MQVLETYVQVTGTPYKMYEMFMFMFMIFSYFEFVTGHEAPTTSLQNRFSTEHVL